MATSMQTMAPPTVAQGQDIPTTTSARRLPRRGMPAAHLWIARVLLAALAVQLFFAGLGVFRITGFEEHAILGSLIVLSSLALPIVAWIGRLESPALRTSWILFGLMILQGSLISLGAVSPIFMAFHPVNAMLLVLVTFSLARGRR